MRTLLSLVFLGSTLVAQTPAPLAAPKPPAVKVQVAVGTSQKRIGGSYRKEMTISPKITVEGVSRIGALPALEATMLIITMDTRAKYVAGQESYSVHSSEMQPLPEVPNGNARQIAFTESSVSFDSYRDSSNVGGAVYKYYVFGLADPATKALVDFQTNNVQLANFCKTHPERREEFLGLRKGDKFPTGFK